MNDLKLDILFKFVFSQEKDNVSMDLLHLLIENVVNKKIGYLSIKNHNILQLDPHDKSVRYDINAEDYAGRKYNIEMQNSSLSQTQIKRLTLYGAKLINEDTYIGDEYRNMKQKIQIILINDHRSSSLIELYDPRNKEGIREGINTKDDDVLLLRFYIFLPYINVIAREKGIDGLNDFEMMIYIIYNGINNEIKKRKERKIIKMITRKIQQFNEDELLKERAFNRAVYLMTEQEEKEEYWNNGKQKGITFGKHETLISMSKSKYPNEDLQWMKECDEAQFNYIQELLLQPIEYKEFYQKIHQFVS